ncbi:MAG: preprotein translocase subunit SecE [Gammaproteobacteria bacterium RIFCSPHIGHO2_12_FULL_41_20]|nr:MAG: preprotein translocase subunit SecE [Gammaproteobacteria bacterium RIFCSPHIGHO2_12_FULL_41_20]
MLFKGDNNAASSSLDKLRWTAAVILLLVGLAANYYYSALPLPLRLVGMVALVCGVGATLAFTEQGKRAIVFVRDARTEMRKVVWPTRQETMQATMVVAVMVIVLALLLWGIDGVLMWLIGWLTGQRG